MVPGRHHDKVAQAGIGLAEIMVALAIGMITILVIMQLMINFEGQKRTTTGSSDAQINGSIAMYSIQRQAQLAGYGLPIYSDLNPALSCGLNTTIDHDANPATDPIGIFPVVIEDGGGGASDGIRLRSSAKMMGAVPLKVTNVVGAEISMVNNFGCEVNDIALIANGESCMMSRVTTVPSTMQVRVAEVPTVGAAGASFSCLGEWTESVYRAANGNLTENGTPSVSGIVNIQAQYGISADPANSQIAAWVDATGATWGNTATTPTLVNRSRIKSIRIAVVARNGLLEKENVTQACSSLTSPAPTGLCAWEGTAGSPAPAIDLSADPLWRRYRYRVFETIIPLRNMIWSQS